MKMRKNTRIFKYFQYFFIDKLRSERTDTDSRDICVFEEIRKKFCKSRLSYIISTFKSPSTKIDSGKHYFLGVISLSFKYLFKDIFFLSPKMFSSFLNGETKRTITIAPSLDKYKFFGKYLRNFRKLYLRELRRRFFSSIRIFRKDFYDVFER